MRLLKDIQFIQVKSAVALPDDGCFVRLSKCIQTSKSVFCIILSMGLFCIGQNTITWNSDDKVPCQMQISLIMDEDTLNKVVLKSTPDSKLCNKLAGGGSPYLLNNRGSKTTRKNRVPLITNYIRIHKIRRDTCNHLIYMNCKDRLDN